MGSTVDSGTVEGFIRAMGLRVSPHATGVVSIRYRSFGPGVGLRSQQRLD
jgi:hypothetical protein